MKRNSSSDVLKVFKQMTYWNLSNILSFSKKFRPYTRFVNMFNKNELKEFQERRMKEQLKFYQQNNLHPQDLRGIRCI